MAILRLLFILIAWLAMSFFSFADSSCPTVSASYAMTSCNVSGTVYSVTSPDLGVQTKYSSSTYSQASSCSLTNHVSNQWTYSCPVQVNSTGSNFGVTVYCQGAYSCPDSSYTLNTATSPPSCTATASTSCNIPPPVCTAPQVNDLTLPGGPCVTVPQCVDTPDGGVCTPVVTGCAGASIVHHTFGLCGTTAGGAGSSSSGTAGSNGGSGGSGSAGGGGSGGSGGSAGTSGAGGQGGAGGAAGTSAGAGGAGGAGGGGGVGGAGGQGGDGGTGGLGGSGGVGGQGGMGGQGGTGGVTDISPVTATIGALGDQIAKTGTACPDGTVMYMGNCTGAPGVGSFTPTSDGSFDSSAADALTQAKQDYNDTFTQIQSDMSNFLPSLTGGGGSLPSVYVGNFKGVDVAYDFSKYANQFSMVANALLFIAYLSAFIIVMRKS